MPIADLHKLWDASLAQHHTDVQTASPSLYIYRTLTSAWIAADGWKLTGMINQCI